MALQQLFLIISLIFNIALVNTVSVKQGDNTSYTSTVHCDFQTTPSQQRLPTNIVPIHYDIKLMTYFIPDNFTFDGEYRADFKIIHPTQNITLHLRSLNLDKKATILIKHLGKTVYKPREYIYYQQKQMLILSFDSELTSGNYSLHTKYYDGNIAMDKYGFFRSDYTDAKGNIKWVFATGFKPAGARQVFPCWDEPALKATFDISIRHTYNYTALSNMQIKRNWTVENNQIWTQFETTPAISPYLVGFVITDFTSISGVLKNITVWCRPQVAAKMKFALNIAEQVALFLMSYTQNEFIPKIDLVAIPDFPKYGKSSNFRDNSAWGLIIYREQDIIYEEMTSDDIENKRLVALKVAKKIVHQWFGNIVSPSWWNHDWLNEAFSVFFQFYALDKIFQNWRIMDEFATRYQHERLHNDYKYFHVSICYDMYNAAFNPALFHRGPYLLRMLQHVLTDVWFRQAVTKYLTKYRFSSASPDDFWYISQDILDNYSDVPNDMYNIIEVMRSWVEGIHFPVLVVSRNWPYAKDLITFTQENFLINRESAEWWIPVTMVSPSNLDFSETWPDRWIQPNNTKYSVVYSSHKTWVIVNIQQIGFYRVMYDIDNWRKIAEYLNSEKYTDIHVINRAQILDDAYHFVLFEQLEPLIFFELMNYLSRETDYIAWTPVMDFLSYLSNAFKYPECTSLQPYILQIFDGLFKNVGYKENPTDDDMKKLMIRFAVKWTCEFGHAECKKIANAKLIKHLDQPETHKILPQWKNWIFCVGMEMADNKTWSQMFDRYMMTKKNEILQYLTCSNNDAIIIDFLEMILKDNSVVYAMKNAERITAISYIIERHARKDTVLNSLLRNLREITLNHLIPITTRLNDIITAVYSKDQLDKITEFIKINYSEDQQILTKAEQLVKTQTRKIQNYIKQFEQTFKSRYFTIKKPDNINVQ